MSADPRKKPSRPIEERVGCEFCLCCGCEKTCTQCDRCSPMHSSYIPLIGCDDYVNMRRLKPLRYLYSCDPLAEYKVHTKLP